MSNDNDKELHKMMRTQMDMDPAQCDPVTLDLIRNKYFGSEDKKQAKEKKRKASQKNNVVDRFEEDEGAALINHSEADIHISNKKKLKKRAVKADSSLIQTQGSVVESQGLDFGDLFNVIEGKDNSNKPASELINTTKLKKQIKNLKRDPSKVLTAPIAGYKKVKIMREQAQELNSKLVSKYIPQVKAEREADQHDFTTADKLRSGGAVNLKSLNQMAANLTEATASSAMEKRIQQELKASGMSNEKALKTAEFDSLSGIDASQLEQRYQQLAKVKTLLFRQEAKNKRIKKIKSKLYHKLKKKDKQREENKVRAYLEEVDPEAAAEIQHKEELKMAEERLRLRHGGHKKWARDMRRFKGKMEDTETREQYHEMMREKNALKDRQSRTRKTVEEVDSDDDSDSDSDQSASDLKRDAVKQIQGELSDESANDESGSSSGSDEDQDVSMNFDQKQKGKKDQSKSKDATGIENMKFMKSAAQNKKDRTKEEARMLIEQIQDNDLSDASEKQGGIFKSSNKFASDKFKVGSSGNAPKIDTAEVLAAAHKIFEKQQQNPVQQQVQEDAGSSSSSDEDAEMSFTSDEDNHDEKALLGLVMEQEKRRGSTQGTEPEKKEKQKKKENVQVNFNDEALEGFNTKSKQLISQNEHLKNLFVTEDSNAVLEQFEKEKEAEIENDLGEKVKVAEVKKGWNAWAGDGVNETKFNEKVASANKVRKERIEELRKQRADNRMRGVIVNAEDRDKKFANKFLVKELPHPFNNKSHYERVMDAAVGKEWATLQTHKRLIQPDVLTKVGEIIKPLSFKKDVSPQTLDTLVAHRANKREKRAPAKF